MAIAVRTGEQTRQVQMVCLDELVGDDDALRRGERLVAWDAARASALPYYSDLGGPGSIRFMPFDVGEGDAWA